MGDGEDFYERSIYMENREKEQLFNKIISTQSLNDCEAVDTLWKALTSVIGLLTGTRVSDRQRLDSIFDQLSDEEMKRLLMDKSVDALIFLDPPLETLLADPGEGSDENSIMRIVAKVRSSKDSDSREALVNLYKVLRRIGERVPHGFKKESEDGDNGILSSTRKILYLLSILMVSKLT